MQMVAFRTSSRWRRAYLGLDSCNAREYLDFDREPATDHGNGNLQ